jgi:single-strand DNA-binding protein
MIGRLTRDPELRTTTTGKSIVEFTIAVDKRIKPQDDGPTADFFRVKAWGATAEFVSNYLGKGRLVAIDGRLETRKWSDNEGNKREIIEIIADNVQSLERPRDDAQPREQSSQATSTGGGDEYDPFSE